MIKISELRADSQINPVGLDAAPRFSWKIESEKRDVIQSGYHLQIAGDAGFANILWQRNVSDRSSVYLNADGFTVKPLTTYHWRVQVWDLNGCTSPWSAPAFFTTAFTEPGQWTAKFITAETGEDARNSKGTLLRTEFDVKKLPVKGYILSTALGLYHLYLNGEKVGADQMAPGWTSYNKHLMYQMYDVTEMLRPGFNALGAMLGAGWYKGLMGFSEKYNNYGSRTALLCQLCLIYPDGSRKTVQTGQDWLCGDAPVLFAEIYGGETYDATKEQPGWCRAGFNTEGWRGAKEVLFSKRALKAQAGVRVRRREVFGPKEIFTTPGGDTVIDFGQNMAGWPGFCPHGRAGEVAELACFETLDAAGNVYTDNLRGAKQTLRYICKGDDGWYEPHFTFCGFRYAALKKWPSEVRAQDFLAVAVYSDMEETGSFSCSNPDINQLQHNIGWSMRSNFLDIPTDCPQRNERVGWTGDAQIFCRTAAYLMDVLVFFRKWLTDVACDQTAEGGVPHVVPDLVTGRQDDDWLLSQGTHSAAAWADVIVLNPWNLYLVYGDEDILRRFYLPMKKWIDFMHNHADGVVWNYRLQFGDWVALDAQPGSYFGATPNELSCTAYYAYSTGIFAKIARILGEEADAEAYSGLYETVKEGFQKLFFAPNGDMTVQTQTAHILALYFGLTPARYVAKTADNLISLLDKESGHLVTGFMGTPYFTHVLSQTGHLDKAYELLLKDDFPSWLYQIRRGATTIWEHWDGIKPDGTMWSPDMNSFNHYAYGAVGDWLYRVAAGIDTYESCPGYRHSLIRPRPGGGITGLTAGLETVYGLLASEWQILEDGLFCLSVQIPPNTCATIILPDVKEILQPDGLTFKRAEEGFAAQAGSGKYSLKCKLL